VRKVSGPALSVGVALIAAMGIAACGSSSSPQSSSGSSSNTSGSSRASGTGDSPFKLLWIGAASGQSKLYGVGQLHGLEAAVSYVNSHGGMAGHQIQLTKEDDGSDPTIATSDLLKYVDAHGAPNAVWAGSESDETGALLPVLAQRHIFSISQTDGPQLLKTNAGVKYQYQFNPQPGSEIPDEAAAAWFKAHGFKKVGILQEVLDYTSAETPLIASALTKEGISHTVATFSPTATDVTPELAELKSAGADAVFVEDLGPAAGYALTGRAQLGWDVPTLGDLAFDAIDVTKLVPAADIKGVYYLEERPASSSASYPALTLYKSYMQRMWGGIGGDGIGSEAAPWDALLSVYEAAKQAHAITAQALEQAMLHLQTPQEPFFVTVHAEQFSMNDHEDIDASAADYPVIPAGPWVDGQVK
jgi:branched-chain amino acid transport system substrate-binding protein